jgi:hypothetical protein
MPRRTSLPSSSAAFPGKMTSRGGSRSAASSAWRKVPHREPAVLRELAGAISVGSREVRSDSGDVSQSRWAGCSAPAAVSTCERSRGVQGECERTVARPACGHHRNPLTRSGRSAGRDLLLAAVTAPRGRRPRRAAFPASGPAELARVGFVAQDTPMYARLTVAKHLRSCRATVFVPAGASRSGRGRGAAARLA